MWNTYRKQAVPQMVREARQRRALYQQTHFVVNEEGARSLSSNVPNFQSQVPSSAPAPQEINQDDMEIIRLIEADCGPAMDWTSGIQEMIMSDGQQSYEPCAPLSFASVSAVENALKSFPTVDDNTVENKARGRTEHAYNEWCIGMSYYMFKYVTHDADTICTETGIHKSCLQRLKRPNGQYYANYKEKFEKMNESELKDHLSTLEVQKHITLKTKSLTAFDIVKIWNLFLQGSTYAHICEKVRIPISTIQAICKRQRHIKITNYFPMDRLLDLQWFRIHWPKNARLRILNTNIAAHNQFTFAFFTCHPEFKAVYDERQKVNFVILNEEKYCNLPVSERSSKSLFPTLPYPSDWDPPRCPTPMQTDSEDNDEPNIQLNETIQHLDIPTLQSGETIDDPPETNTDTVHDDPAETFKLPENLCKKTFILQRKVYDKYSICHAYYLRKYLGLNASNISAKTGVDIHMIYYIQCNKSQFYRDYINEIEDMGKKELEEFLLKLQPSNQTQTTDVISAIAQPTWADSIKQVDSAQSAALQKISVEPHDSELPHISGHAKQVTIDEHCYALSYYMSKFEKKGFEEIIQATGISYNALKRLLSDNPNYCSTVKTKIKNMSKLELETYISKSKGISYKFFNRQSTTFDMIVTIWNMRLQNMSYTEISHRTNLPIPTVNFICIGKRQSKITQYLPLDRRLDPSWFEMHWTELSKTCIVSTHFLTQMNFVKILLNSHHEFKAVHRSKSATELSTALQTVPLNSSRLPLFPTSGYSPSCISEIREMLMNMPEITEKDPLAYIKILPEPQASIPRLQHGGTEMFENRIMATEELRIDLAQHSVDPVGISGDLAELRFDLAECSFDFAEPSVDPVGNSFDLAEPGVGLSVPIFDPAESSIDLAGPNVIPADQSEPAEQPQEGRKRKYNRYVKTHDKYTICYAYYLKKFMRQSGRYISQETGIDYNLIYILYYNKSQLYSDYINEIKDMSKEKLEEFLHKLQNPQ
jgi:hypothetical protein